MSLNRPLCKGCRDHVDCYCDSSCANLETCTHGCYLSRYTKPYEAGYFGTRVPQPEEDTLGHLHKSLTDLSKRVKDLLDRKEPSEEVFRTDDPDLLKAIFSDDYALERDDMLHILKILAPRLPPDLLARIGGAISSYGARTDVLDVFNAGVVIGNNRTRDGKHEWTEIRIILPTRPEEEPT